MVAKWIISLENNFKCVLPTTDKDFVKGPVNLFAKLKITRIVEADDMLTPAKLRRSNSTVFFVYIGPSYGNLIKWL